MHCLFLGIAKYIVQNIWINEGILGRKALDIIQARIDNISTSPEVCRIPRKIATGVGFSNFKADQWKSFTIIFATPTIWDLLPSKDQLILANFVRACQLLYCRMVSMDAIETAHLHFLTLNKLIEAHYGPHRVTMNMHLALHIKECCYDYGPIYAFWCFSYERMNGILGI